MSKAMPSKTINPLHFEDLEPKRFEDLVRQLIYKYKDWARLEATGAGGSDDGFDARGIVNQVVTENDKDINENEDIVEKIWLVQCKREKRITPKKMENYLADIKEKAGALDGLLFVASATFSKKCYDIFREFCVQENILVFELWGSKEIEDRLYQAENDNLLFAYFGISLHIKKQTQIRRLRTNIQTRTKLLACGIRRAPKRDLDFRSHLIANLFELSSIDDSGLIDYQEEGLQVKLLCVDDINLFILTEENFAYADIKKEVWNYYEEVNLIKQGHGFGGAIPADESRVRSKWASHGSEFQFMHYKLSAIRLHKILVIDKRDSNDLTGEFGRIIVQDGVFKSISTRHNQFLQEQYGASKPIHEVTDWKRNKRLTVPKSKNENTS